MSRSEWINEACTIHLRDPLHPGEGGDIAISSPGEPLNPEVIKAWRDATGLTLHEGYVQTETVLCIEPFHR